MATRQYQIPGGPFINETSTRQWGGQTYINETVSVAAAFQAAWAVIATVTIQAGAKPS
jgi:hypothetical protein